MRHNQYPIKNILLFQGQFCRQLPHEISKVIRTGKHYTPCLGLSLDYSFHRAVTMDMLTQEDSEVHMVQEVLGRMCQGEVDS